MIRVIGRTYVALRFIKHKVTRAVLLNQRVAIIFYVVFWQQFERGIPDDFTIHGNTATADLTPGNSAADAELLSDKFIKSHECDFACKNTGIGRIARKVEPLSAQYSGLTTSLKGKRFVAYYTRVRYVL